MDRIIELPLLEQQKIKFETLIKNYRKDLETIFPDYKDFYYNRNKKEFYFFITRTCSHKTDKQTPLDELWDFKTKRPLDKKSKTRLKGLCERIFRLERSLGSLDNEIIKLYLGNDTLEKQALPIAPNRKYTLEMYEYTSRLITKGILKNTAYRETLESFGEDVSKFASYGKSYRKHLKEK